MLIICTNNNYYFVKVFFFDVYHFKVFIEFITVLILFYVVFFSGHEACRILAPWPGMEPTSLALEGEVLTTGPPGKSL